MSVGTPLPARELHLVPQRLQALRDALPVIALDLDGAIAERLQALGYKVKLAGG